VTRAMPVENPKEGFHMYAKHGELMIVAAPTGLLAWTPEEEQSQLALDLDKVCSVNLTSPALAYIINETDLIEWDIAASTSREITVPEGMNISAFMFIGRIGDWLFLTKKQSHDWDTGLWTMAQPLIAIHHQDCRTKLIFNFSHQNDVKLSAVEDGTIALILDKRVLLFDPELSASYEPKLDRSLGIVLSVSEDWSNPMRWMAVGPKGAELIDLESDSMFEPIETSIAYASGAEFKGDKMIVWDELRGMGEYGHSGDFAIMECEKNVRWRTRHHLQEDDIQLEILRYGTKITEELNSKVPAFCPYSSYATTFVGEYVVVVQDQGYHEDRGKVGIVFLFKGTQFLDGLTDERVTDPFWVKGNRLLFRVPPDTQDGSSDETSPPGFFSISILEDKFGDLQPVTLSDLGLEEVSDIAPDFVLLRDRDGNTFRPYRDISYGGMDPICLNEIGCLDSLPSCIDGTINGHGKQHVSIGMDTENTLCWHAFYEAAFILHRIAYLNFPGWEMFPKDSIQTLGIQETTVPALTPVLKSETFFVAESDGTVVPVSVVNP